jgi:hypothetical protein
MGKTFKAFALCIPLIAPSDIRKSEAINPI